MMILESQSRYQNSDYIQVNYAHRLRLFFQIADGKHGNRKSLNSDTAWLRFQIGELKTQLIFQLSKLE